MPGHKLNDLKDSCNLIFFYFSGYGNCTSEFQFAVFARVERQELYYNW